MRGDGVVALGLRLLVAETLREQLARALYRMLLFINLMALVVPPAGEGFARAAAILAMLDASGETGHQRGAFDQPLRVDHHIILARLQIALEAHPLFALLAAEPVFAPAANGDRQDFIHRRMPGGDLGEILFHHPVEANARDRLHRVG